MPAFAGMTNKKFPTSLPGICCSKEELYEKLLG